jgi:ketosteroid isomerase-like protein
MSRRIALLPVSRTCLLLLSVLASAPQLMAQTAAPAPPAGPPPHGRHGRAQIENLEQQWRTASLNGDAATMDKLLSDDSWTGQVNTKAMQLDRIRSHTIVYKSMDLSDVKVKMAQSVAIVTCRAMVESVNDGRETSGDFRYTRVYLRQPNGVWKITNFEATRIPTPGGPGRHKGPPPPPEPPPQN